MSNSIEDIKEKVALMIEDLAVFKDMDCIKGKAWEKLDNASSELNLFLESA